MNPSEHAVWQRVGPGWRRLYGSMRLLGMSIEAHEFATDAPLDWGRSFHQDSLEVCLNLHGRGEVVSGSAKLAFTVGTIGYYFRALEPLRGVRAAGEQHRFITVELSQAWLVRVLARHEAALAEPLRESLFAGRRTGGVGSVGSMSARQQETAAALLRPGVSVAARPLWFEAKVLELLSELVFDPAEEFFCGRQQRMAQRRVAQTKQILAANLVEPPTLEELGREVGVSGWYLSRIFSHETGVTISQFLRRARMERAAELLSAGTHNVGESAFAVGYSSLGHFSKSFSEIMGASPNLYLHVRRPTASAGPPPR